MADDIVFDLLHSEIVNYALEQNKDSIDKKEVDLSAVEYIGFAAGYKIMERLTREWPRFKDELDTMKFICTDFWTCIYKKQIDNLRTNHQGVYVLQDNAFRFLTNFSSGLQYLEFAPRLLASGMADDIVFDLLHSEIVNYALEQNKDSIDKKEVDLSAVEYIGFAAGYKIMERLTREWPRFKDELDTMKFICTDFWTCIYKKQIDNLRTNHQGVYVLQDNAFRFLTNFSSGLQYLEFAPRYVAYTCGLIRGGLANLCINSVVTAEVQSMPSCKFHIHVQRT